MRGSNVAGAEENSLQKLRRYGEELSRKRVEDEPVYRRWLLAKQTIWLTLLTVFFLIFYLIEIMQSSLDLLRDKL